MGVKTAPLAFTQTRDHSDTDLTIANYHRSITDLPANDDLSMIDLCVVTNPPFIDRSMTYPPVYPAQDPPSSGRLRGSAH